MEMKITDIRECWERIKPGLEMIKRRCAAEWRVEDVYSKCGRNEWTLFTAEGVDGFLILWMWDSPYMPEKILQIECAYHAGELDPFEVFEPMIFELARKNKCTAVQFRSPRVGFARKGWKEVDIVYRREVDHG